MKMKAIKCKIIVTFDLTLIPSISMKDRFKPKFKTRLMEKKLFEFTKEHGSFTIYHFSNFLLN